MPSGLPIAPAADGTFNPMSKNVKVYGAIYSAESCSYDPTRDLIVVPNRGVGQNVQTNNAWVSFINHDGSVHTARWIGLQNPGEQRDNLNPKLVLNEPLGSDIVNGVLYLADRDGGTSPDRSAGVGRAQVQHEDGRAGRRSAGAEVAPASTTSRWPTTARSTPRRPAPVAQTPDPTTWQVWKITPSGEASILVQGAPLRQPNGIALDPKGNIVVVMIGNDEVLTFTPTGMLVSTEKAAQAGNDGLVIRARRHEVREQRGERRRVADSARSAGRAHRPEHPQPGVDVLRRGRRTSW